MRISDWSSDVCSSDLSEIDASDRLGLLHLRQQRLIKRRYIAIIQPKEVKLHSRALQRRRALGRIGPARRNLRSEERRVGKESVSTCRSEWTMDEAKKNTERNITRKENRKKKDKKNNN